MRMFSVLTSRCTITGLPHAPACGWCRYYVAVPSRIAEPHTANSGPSVRKGNIAEVRFLVCPRTLKVWQYQSCQVLTRTFPSLARNEKKTEKESTARDAG